MATVCKLVEIKSSSFNAVMFLFYSGLPCLTFQAKLCLKGVWKATMENVTNFPDIALNSWNEKMSLE